MDETFSMADTSYTSLKHYGVLGMKWGVRRYQNEDGTLTEAGKERYSKNSNWEKRARKLFVPTIKAGKDRPNMTPAEKIGKESINVVNEFKNIRRSTKDIKERGSSSNDSIKELSDEELRKIINRLEMEQRYSQLNAAAINRGRDNADDILDIVGGVLSIGLSGAMIYSLIKHL